MNDRTNRHAGTTGQSHGPRDSAGAGSAGHDRTGGNSDADGVADPAGKSEGAEVEDADAAVWAGLMRQPWTRRAVAGGLLLAAGGAVFGFTRTGTRPVRHDPVRTDGGMVPLRHPMAEGAAQEGVLPEAGEAVVPSPGQAATPTEPANVPARLLRPSGPAQIAIVLDDLGLRQEETRWATSLPGPLTLAFLPYGQSLADHARRAAANGHEVILHLPMDSGGRADPGPKALRLGLDSAELERRLQWNLAQVPGIVGVNNHMGSALTENAAAMEVVLTRLKLEGRYFLDSRTTARSAARAASDRLGVPYAERDVFLDNDTSPQAIARQLAETEELASRYGSAIAIGHPHRQTLKALETWVGSARERGFDIVPVSTVIATRGSALWRLARDRKGSAGS